MGKKKSQKKGESSQTPREQPQQAQAQAAPQQPQQAQAQAAPQQPQPGPSGDSSGGSRPASGKGKGKKQQQQQAQQHPPSERPQTPQQKKQQGRVEEKRPQTPSGRRDTQPQPQQQSQPQQQQPPRPADIPVQGAWQRGGPQQPKGPDSHQSTPSPQPHQMRGPPQQQGRGKGRGQPVQQPGQGSRQKTPPQQLPGSPHSASPSPQPGQGVWGQPRPQSPRHQLQQTYLQGQGPPPGFSQPVHPPPQQYQQMPPGYHQQQQQWQQLPQQFQQMQMQPGVPQRPQPPPGFSQQQQQSAAPQQMQQQRPGMPQPQGAWQRPQMPPQQQPLQQPLAQQPPPLQAPPQRAPQPQQPVGVSTGRAAPQQATQKPRGERQPTGPPPKATPSTTPATPKEEPKKTDDPTLPPPVDLPMPRRKILNSAGTAGRKILIETNHLALTLRKLDFAIHYDVVIQPDTPKKLLRAAIEEFRRQNYPERYPAFDGSRNLYSSTFLPFGDYIDGDVTIIEDERSRTFNITIRFASRVDLSMLSRYFEAGGDRNRHMITPQDAIQCLDVVLRSAPALHCTPVGRSFFTKPRDKIINLSDGMEMYYGFYQSAILGWKPFLNVDVAHKAFPKCMNVVDLIIDLCPRVNLNSKLTGYDFETVDKFMRNLKVQYEIPKLPTSRRVMRVNQLDKSASEARFQTDDNQEMTVTHYFKTVKGYDLRYPNLPCLWVGSRARDSKILFPVELCTVLEGQVTNRAMTPNQTSSMIKVAATSTTVRKDKILHSIRTARFNQDPSAREFGMSVSEEFAKVPARVLDAPNLRYNGISVRPERGTWRATKFQNGKSLSNWAIINVDDRTRPPALQEFAEAMIQQGKPLGMAIAKPRALSTIKLTYRREKQELEQHFAKYKDTELLVVVISENKDIYNSVKQAAELTVGTLTQCVRGKNVFRPKPATVGNILLKINAKLNGINHVLELRPKCLDRPCMIMGADVTHPSPDSRGTVPSVAAVTASHDPSAFQYNICWRLQPPAQEIITDLAEIVKQHLLFFYRKNNSQKPERIIFFRDGVSEGQFQTVLNAEVNTIRQACSMVQKDGMYKPKITFLVVQKRHHTRFFPTNPRDSEDRNFNVPAGTIVDTEITHPTALDFYLVSHASIQGVARPTKYRMLWDDNDMNEDELEQLTYHLCHMFTRCTRSVSYPAPTYYAHLAAARAKVYCERRQLNMDDLEREQGQLVIKPEVIKDLPMFFV